MPYTIINGVWGWAPDPAPVVPLVNLTEEVRNRPNKDCKCKACKLVRREADHGIVNGMLRRYDFEPRPWRFYDSKAEKSLGLAGASNLYMGVELETDNYRVKPGAGIWGTRIRSNVDNRKAIGLRQPKQLWIAKRDGSVTGPEFVSHPATMAYWNEKVEPITEMFSDLLHAGYRSYDNDTCGMHINISKSAVDDWQHLFRFLSLIYENPRLMAKLSQRTAQSIDRWATLNIRGSLAHIAMTTLRDGRAFGQPRSTALNLTQNSRMEFRLPRGTLRVERFYKNLEWVESMLDFSREDGKMSATRYTGYVKERAAKWPNLADFIKPKSKTVTV